ncbi:MAG: SH3 beta-barrel fold-containing protein [Opitutae bacterium]|jgi:hypothetical protein
MTRDEMQAALAKGVCTVVFTKLNGEERTMHCTANTEFMPEDKRPRSAIDGRNHVISAYDVRIADWRSFRVDSVKEFKV